MERIKVKVTSKKYDDGKSLNKIISIPATIKSRFLYYGYGELVKESPEEKVNPEEKKKKGRKPKTK